MIVLGIEETALSNYNNLKRLQFGGTQEEIKAAAIVAFLPILMGAIRDALEPINAKSAIVVGHLLTPS